MSRRKQAKPRSFKPELDTRTTPLAMLPYEPAFLDDQDAASSDLALAATDTTTGPFEGEGNIDGNFNPRSPFQIEKQETNDSLESEALGTDHGSSSRSETPEDTQTSPTPSSCATPNSSTDLPDAELSFTVGITEATPYACQFCDKAFPRLSFLKKHEQTHGDHMPFRCEFCSRLFKHKRSRDRHIKLHTGDKKYRCTHCEAAFSRSDHLKIHMKTHDTQKPFQCTVCNRGYNTAAALTSHMQNHKRQRPETPSGGMGGGSASNSAKTIGNASEESISSPDSFHCSQCGDSFKKQDHLQTHILNAHTSNLLSPEESSRKSVPLTIPEQLLPQLTPKLACIYCTKDSFTTMEQLQLHVQAMHSSILNGELREFSLGRTTSTSSPHHLMTPPPALISGNGHLSTSTSLYSCDLCTMRFPTLHRLRKHSLTVHRNCDFTHQKEMNDAVQQNPLVCVQCALPFHTSAAFTEHYLMVHGGSSPSLSAVSPAPEQVKPTDLSRKTPRSGSEDRKSKRLCVNEDGSSRLDLMTPTASTGQYDYPSMLLCNQCDAALPDFESFRTHLKSHLEQTGGVRSFLQTGGTSLMDAFQQETLKLQNNCICPHCGATFKDLVSCEQHIYAHFLSTAVEYGCQSCLKMFPKPDELQKHLMDIHAHHLYRCSLCKEMFDSKVAIQVHFAVKHSNECKLYRCTACPTSVSMFHTELEFSLHVRTVHGAHALLSALQSHSKTLRCMFCRQVFGSDLEMQFHLATHTKQFRCPICSESFQIEFLLDRHIQTYHSNARNINGETDDSIDGEKSIKKSSSNSPHQVGKTHSSPGRISQKSSSGENNNVKKQHEVSQLNNCDICERNDFTTESELVAHRKLVHHARNTTKNGVVSLHCAYCNENCKTRTELENHMKSHSQSSGVSGKHKCNICDEICPSAVLLAEHKLTHCKVISGNCCTQCKASLTTEEQFYSHLVQHSNNNNNATNQKSKSQVALPTPCVICRQTLISDVEVRIHSQFHLRNTMQQAEYQCSICFKIVDVQNVIVAKGSYICSECYSMPNDSQQRSFHCTECQFSFETSLALEQHMDSAHSKTYTCIKCQASFDNERDVQIHVTTHLMTEGSNHECHLCRRLFAGSMKLQAHLIEHTFAGCGGFTCYLCSAVFTGAQGLQNHIIEHGLAARPYDCPQCNMKFFFRAELDNHSYSHLGRSSRTSAEVDVSLLSPKAYYVSVNGKYDPIKNGELSKYYVKDHKNKKGNKNAGTEVQNQKNTTDHAAVEIDEKPIVKEEPNDETEESKEEYVDVDFPTTSTKFKNEQSSVGESSTFESGENPNVTSD